VSQDAAALAQRLVELVNEARVAEGLLPLRRNEALMTAAQAFSQDMAAHGFFGHVSSEGLALPDRLWRAGYASPEQIAENIAAGWGSAESVFRSWMNSPPHRRNLLHSNLREIGVGYLYQPRDTFGPYYHYWTVDLGARRGVYPVVIAREALSTASRAVELHIHGSGWAREMAIANDAPPQGTAWETYRSVRSWLLNPRLGQATVYVSLRGNDGQSSIVSDTIHLTGQSISFRQGQGGYSGVSDAYITSWAPDANYATAKGLPVRADGAKVILIRFDLSTLSPRSVVGQAMLRFYIVHGGPQPLAVRAYRLLRPWQASAVTWRQAAPGVLWALPGASQPESDRAATPAATCTLNQPRSWASWDITSLVQEWIADPGSNLGLVLVGTGADNAEYLLASSEQWRGNLRPILELSFWADEPPTPTPTPSMAATNTPSSTHSPTLAATSTLSPRPSVTWTAAPPPTASPTLSPSATATLTPPPTPAQTPGPSPTPITVIFQYGVGGYYGALDTFISRWAPDDNWSGSGSLEVRSDGAKAALLRFDVSRIPPDGQVERAILSLYVTAGGPHPMEVSAYGIIRLWDVQQVTWRSPLVGSLWAVPGCNGPGSDRIPYAADTASLVGNRRWMNLDVTYLVASWTSNPELNDGLVLHGSGNVATQYSFASAEHWKPSERPCLRVVYRIRSHS